jgi:hypothetical protein
MTAPRFTPLILQKEAAGSIWWWGYYGDEGMMLLGCFFAPLHEMIEVRTK